MSYSNIPYAHRVREVVGIALDGRKIYGPFNNAGGFYLRSDVDICNGMIIDGEYAYVMTTFYPYTVGCWGEGDKTSLKASCS
jgi:hypothetical protein